MAKNNSFSRGKQFLLIAIILLILGGVLLLTETPEDGVIKDITEEPGVVTNVELVGEMEEVDMGMEMMNDDVVTSDDNETGIVEEVKGNTSGKSADIVRNYFKAYNGGEFDVACDVISNDKCNAKNPGDVSRFAQEFNKMNSGYENLNFWVADSTDFHSDVICVEYDYTYKTAPTVQLHEIMSFYVSEGKISSRVCEGKTADGSPINCPIISKRDFCL